MLAADFLHKLSEKGLGQRAVNMWCIATSRFKPLILRATFLSINVLKDSPFSCWMLTLGDEVYLLRTTLQILWPRSQNNLSTSAVSGWTSYVPLPSRR